MTPPLEWDQLGQHWLFDVQGQPHNPGVFEHHHLAAQCERIAQQFYPLATQSKQDKPQLTYSYS